MKVSEIQLGTRHRKDLGDIAGLAESIRVLGLLHPVVINDAHELVAGRRRLEAVKTLGWDDVPVTVAKNLDDVVKLLKAERDENTCRKDFLPSEAASLAKVMEPFERKAAAERQAKAGPSNGRGAKPSASEKLSEPVGRAADKVAEAVGVHRHTLTKINAVMDAAEEDPEHYGDLPEKMDEGGKVDPVYREMVERAASHPLPDGPTPAEIARNSPAVKWSKLVHNLYSLINSMRLNGGIAKLAARWSAAHRDDYIRDIRKVRDALTQTLKEMETANV